MDPEMEKNMGWVIANCICRQCPSFVECGERAAYCFPLIGKSACIHEEKGCICLECSVYPKVGLKHVFYCTRGSRDEQEAMG